MGLNDFPHYSSSSSADEIQAPKIFESASHISAGKSFPLTELNNDINSHTTGSIGGVQEEILFLILISNSERPRDLTLTIIGLQVTLKHLTFIFLN